MSNENSFYCSPYSSLHPNQQTHQTEHQSRCPSTVITSSTPYYGLQATAIEAAAAARALGASQDQLQRYTQPPPSFVESHTWFHDSTNKATTDLRTSHLNLGETWEEDVGDGPGFTYKSPYQSAGFDSYAYASNLGYGSMQKDGHQQSSSRGGGIMPDNRVLRVPVSYQNYTGLSEEHSMILNTVLGTAQHLPTQNQWHNSANEFPDTQSRRSDTRPAPSSTGNSSNNNTTSVVPMNVALPRGRVASKTSNADNQETLRQNNAQSESPIPHFPQQRPTLASKNLYSHKREKAATPSSISRARRQQRNVEFDLPNPKVPIPPVSVPQSSGTPTNQATGVQHNRQAESIQPSNLVIAPNISQARTYSEERVSEYFIRTSQALDDQTSPQSAQLSQTQLSKGSIPPRDSMTTLQSSSSSTHTIANPIYVYNHYHDYQKQIEVADAEHATLTAFKAERGDAEATAARATMNLHKRGSLKSNNKQIPNSNEVIAAHDVRASLSLDLGKEASERSVSDRQLLTSGANQNQSTQKAQKLSTGAASPQKSAPAVSATQQYVSTAVNPGVITTMEEEMRQMVEKMREYQKQDPKLFSQVWETVKRTQSPHSVQAQANAGEGFVHTSIDIHDTDMPHPTSKIARQGFVANVVGGVLSSLKTPLQSESYPNAVLTKCVAEQTAVLASGETQNTIINLSRLGYDRSFQSTSLLSNEKIEQNERSYTPVQFPSNSNKSTVPSTVATPPLQRQLYDSQYTNSTDSGWSRNYTAIRSPSNQAILRTASPIPIDPALLSGVSSSIPSEGLKANNKMPNPPESAQTSSKPATTSGRFNPVVLWPEKYRNAIATVASKVINANPENAGKAIHANQILDIFNHNQSYVDLCQSIENMGFGVNRTRFAERLLAVIRGDDTKLLHEDESRRPPQMRVGRTSAVSKEPEVQNEVSIIHDTESSNAQRTAPKQIVFTSSEVDNSTKVITGPSEPTFANAKSGLRGPRGPYKKTRDRITALQKSSNSLKSVEKTPQQSSASPIQVQLPHQDSVQQPTSLGSTQTPVEEVDKHPTLKEPAQPQWSIQTDSSVSSIVRSGSNIQIKDGSDPHKRVPMVNYRMSAIAPSLNTNGDATLSIAIVKPSLIADPIRVSQPQSIFPHQRQGSVVGENPGDAEDILTGARANRTMQPNAIIALRDAIPQNISHLIGCLSVSSTHIQTVPESTNWHPYLPFTPGQSSQRNTHGSSSTTAKSLVAATGLPTQTTKEVTARKRTFAEIIDLSSNILLNAVDHDQSPTSHKIKRIITTSCGKGTEYGAGDQPLTKKANIKTSACVKSPAREDHADVKAIPQSIPNPFRDFENVVKPIAKSVPLRKSRYDPKTIAYDILITTSQHPFQRGLNAHLGLLKRRFSKISDLTDLSTIRWDLLDPGGLPVGSANMSTSSTEPLNESSTSSQTHSAKKPNAMNNTIPRAREILRPTRGGSSLRGSRDSDRQSNQASVPAQSSGLRYSSSADFVSDFAVIIDSIAPPVNTTRRPPGKPPKGLQTDLQDADQLPSLSPRRIRRPPERAQNSTGISTIPIKRKLGRPRIRPLPESKVKKSTLDPKSAIPKFIPFLCEWKNCKAELHNLETLRRHIFTVHDKKKSSEEVLCQWAKCGSQDLLRDKVTLAKVMVHKPYDFNSIESWKDHIERSHLIPLAWHMGDGPRGSTLDGSESDGTEYGSDKSSQKSTPSFDGRMDETESVIVSNSRQSLRRSHQISPSLEATVRLVSPVIQAGFFMPENSGWTYKKRTEREIDPETLPTFGDSHGSGDG